jgi:ATP/ADP translocase
MIYALMSVFAPTIDTLATAAGMGSTGTLGVATGVNILAGPLMLFIKWLGTSVGPIVMTLVGILVFLAAHFYDKRQRAKDATVLAQEFVVEEQPVVQNTFKD